MNKPSVYLAGPMTGLTMEEASAWREEVRARLKHKWTVISPTDIRYSGEYDGPDGSLTAPSIEELERLPEHLRPGALVTMDEFFVDRSEFVLVNLLGATVASIGTMWEMGYAWAKGKKIVTIIDPENIHDHPFVYRRSHVLLSSVEEAIMYLGSLVACRKN